MKNKLILLSLLISSSLFGQNYLFENNSSGFHIAGQISSYDGSTLLGVSPGYTSKGKLTFGITIGFEENDNLDGSSTGIKPYVSYLVIKQGSEMPVSVGLNASYQYNTFSEYDIKSKLEKILILYLVQVLVGDEQQSNCPDYLKAKAQ